MFDLFSNKRTRSDIEMVWDMIPQVSTDSRLHHSISQATSQSTEVAEGLQRKGQEEDEASAGNASCTVLRQEQVVSPVTDLHQCTEGHQQGSMKKVQVVERESLQMKVRLGEQAALIEGLVSEVSRLPGCIWPGAHIYPTSPK